MGKNWRTFGPVAYDRWRSVIAGQGGPAGLAARAPYEAAGDLSALCLAMLGQESSYGTDFDADPASNLNPLNLRPRGGDGFVAFASYADCVSEWRARLLDPTYAYAGTVTLEDLIHVYAPSADHNNEAEYVASIRARFAAWGIGGEVMPVNQDLRIILNPGHRNTTGGNAEEQSLTPALAQSYFAAFSAAGYETVNLGDTNGDLDATSRRMAEQIESAPGAAVLLDLHYEGSAAPGCFAIIPNGSGLVTGANAVQDPNDTWEKNPLDRRLGKAIVDGIVAATGLTLRQGIREPGLMDEHETDVGQGHPGEFDPSRLATFAWTSPFRDQAVRLVVEHGNHTIEPDRSIIFENDFTERCAAAAVAAVTAVYGAGDQAHVPTVPWGKEETGLHQLNGHQALAFYGAVTAKKNARVRETADMASKVILTIKKGETAIIRGTVRSDDARWALIDLGEQGVGRARLSSFEERWPVPPA